MRPLRFLSYGCAMLSFTAIAYARAELEIAVGDKVRVSVHDQKQLDHTATVAADGLLWMPMIGTLAAARLTPTQLRDAIASKYSKDSSIRIEDINVEVVEFRPFYIDGTVSKPGAYPFTLGLTIRKAIALAGGTSRATDDNLRMLVSDDPRSSQLTLRYHFFHRQARVARLQAELDGKSEFEWAPADRLKVPDDFRRRLSDAENRLLKARRANFELEVANTDQLVALFQQEVDALQRQDATLSKEEERSSRLLSDLRNLKERGVISLDRIASTERDVFSTRYARDSTRSQLAGARRQHKELEGKKAQLATSRRQELLSELQSALVEVDSLGSQLIASANRHQLASLTSEHLCGSAASRHPFTIFRQKLERTVRLEAGEDTPVHPGDVLAIETPSQLYLAHCSSSAPLAK